MTEIIEWRDFIMMGKKQLEGFLKTFSNDKSKEIILCDPKNQNQIVSELNKKQQELVNDVKSGYFIDVVLVENWEIEKGLVEDPIIGKNGQYYFTLGDNFDSSDISLFISDAKENVMEKISYEIINDRHQHIEIYRDIRSNEFICIVKNIVSNKFSLGIAGNGRKSRFFWLKDFNENLAQGYIKLVQIENGLGIQVIDTYNLESKEEEEDFLNSGYIKVGYPPILPIK